LEVVAGRVVRAAVVVRVVARVVRGPPMGAVEAPAIWDETAGEKVPVMPLRVNRAEKASAGNWGAAESLRERDS